MAVFTLVTFMLSKLRVQAHMKQIVIDKLIIIHEVKKLP